MKAITDHEFTEKQKQAFHKAKLLSYISIVYLLITAVLYSFVQGQSQAIKSEFWETLLCLIAPISFLISSKICWRKANKKFPYGYHRASSIAFICAALTLLALGSWLSIEAVIKLIENPPIEIPNVKIGDLIIWQGWLMIAVLIWSSIGPIILGRMKLPLAHELHDKTLYTDALTSKAEWTSSLAAIVGILCIGFFQWWRADALAALLISGDIFYDGFCQLKRAVADLADREAVTLEGKEEPVIKKIQKHLNSKDWIEKSEVRLREHGHLLAGSAFIKAKSYENLFENIEKTNSEIREFDWRIKDFFVIPMNKL